MNLDHILFELMPVDVTKGLCAESACRAPYGTFGLTGEFGSESERALELAGEQLLLVAIFSPPIVFGSELLLRLFKNDDFHVRRDAARGTSRLQPFDRHWNRREHGPTTRAAMPGHQLSGRHHRRLQHRPLPPPAGRWAHRERCVRCGP